MKKTIFTVLILVVVLASFLTNIIAQEDEKGDGRLQARAEIARKEIEAETSKGRYSLFVLKGRTGSTQESRISRVGGRRLPRYAVQGAGPDVYGYFLAGFEAEHA